MVKKASASAASSRPTSATPSKTATTSNTRKLTLTPPSLDAIDALDALDVDTLVLCLTPSMRPLPGAAGFVDWRLCGEISRLIVEGVATGNYDDKVLLPGHRIDVDRIVLFGFGDDIANNARQKIQQLAGVLDGLSAKKVALALPEPAGDLVKALDAKTLEDALSTQLGSRLVTLFAPES